MRRSVSPRLAHILAARAAGLRAAATWSERVLWQELRAGKLGVAFRRQVPVGRYIADFAAPSVALIVEIDGGYHAPRSGLDARRDRELARLGWRVLRLPEELVSRNTAEAVERVRAALSPA